MQAKSYGAAWLADEAASVLSRSTVAAGLFGRSPQRHFGATSAARASRSGRPVAEPRIAAEFRWRQGAYGRNRLREHGAAKRTGAAFRAVTGYPRLTHIDVVALVGAAGGEPLAG